MEEKQNTGGKLTYIEELHRKRQNRKIRNTAALALVLAVLVFYFTGTYASAFSALAEAAESVQIFLNRSGSFPAKTGIVEPLQAEVLARLAALGLDTGTAAPAALPTAKHIFTHIEWLMSGVQLHVPAQSAPAGYIWASREQLRTTYALPGAFRAYKPLLL